MPKLARGSDREERWQQFQLQLLERARTLPEPEDPTWIPVRLLHGARRATNSWQKTQRRYQPLPLSPLLPTRQDVGEEVALAALIPPDNPLFRHVVLGETYERQASRLGVTAAALRQRAHRELTRLRCIYRGD